MARRKARWQSSSAQDEKMEAFPRLWQTATLSKPKHATTKKGVARAQQKHLDKNLPSPTPPTLADRFNALPPELRAHIFSFLIVQPVKWDVSHQDSCPLRTRIVDITPQTPMSLWHGKRTCVCCDSPSRHDAQSPREWRRDLLANGLDIYTSPWRSRWAPEQRNPYLCTHCYDEKHRERPFPEPMTLPCLCARRQNLEVLLVCKKWYLQAAQVFYTQNTFAFEYPDTFIKFIETLPQQWRSKISKVSLMSFSGFDEGHPINLDWRYSFDSPTQVNYKQWSPVWSLLRSLTSLSILELDSRLLKNVNTAHSLLKLGLRNLRQISFVERTKDTREMRALWSEGMEKIWPSVASRVLIRGGWAHEVGCAIKGERRMLLKGKHGKSTVQKAVRYCINPDVGIFESSVFEELGFSKTDFRYLYSHHGDIDDFDDDHLGLLGLHLA